ncbi:ribosomal protein L7/L12 [Nocardioides sp. W7]|uniref:ribosomal protein L7/L12 n=1 Tax=Nocardioides sp. W7 TaxID=2931390 RepID=UPI001FCF9FF0|nr:ribosomal protein L7/L12 [Nocardioides sp. W7]
MGFFDSGPSRSDHHALVARIHRLEATVAMLAERQGLTPAQVDEAATAHVSAEARLLKQQGRAIEAIKVVREQTGLGLREAKDLVDRL